MYKNKPKFYLRLDEVEWEAGYKAGNSSNGKELDPCYKAKSKAYCAGYIAGQKAKEGDNS